MSNARKAFERIAAELQADAERQYAKGPDWSYVGDKLGDAADEILAALAEMESEEPVLWIDTDELERVRKSNRDVWLPAYIGPNYENATQPLYLKADRRKE